MTTLSKHLSTDPDGEELRTACRAFTLTELLVVVVVILMLACLTVASTLHARDRNERVECASNLRQIGVALSVYTAESDGRVPVCGWPEGGNPWQTYSMARVIPGTSTITRGYMGLGLLFRTG